MNKTAPESALDEFLLVGGIILEPSQIPDVVTMIEPSDFFHGRYRLIYESILRVETKLSSGSDWTIVRDDMTTNKTLGDIPEGLFEELLQKTVNPSNAIEHAKIVKRISRVRTLRGCCSDLTREIDASKHISSKTVSKAYQLLMRSLLDSAGLAKVRPFAEVLAEFDFGALSFGHDENYPRTDLPSLDRQADLFPERELTIIAGRPGMGKTTFLRQICLSVARRHHVLFCTMEEPSKVIMSKMVCSQAGVPYHRMLHLGKNLPQHDASLLAVAQGQLVNIKIDLIDSSLSAAQVSAYTRQLSAKGRAPRVIIVDHLQHMRHEREKSENDAAMFGRSVKALKDLAKDSGAAVVLACQLNRSVESRNPPRPYLSDLRDTGTAEEVASTVLCIWSEEVADDERKMLVAKQRHGPPFEQAFDFDRKLGLFLEKCYAP